MNKKRNLKKFLTSFLAGTMVVSSLFVYGTGISAMETNDLSLQNGVTFQNLEMDKNFKTPAYISGNLSRPSKENPEEIIEKYIKADKDNSFIVYKKFKNPQNENIIKTIQTYKGIKVKGTLQSYIIGADGIIHNISGIFIPQMDEKIAGIYRLSEKDALEVVKKDLNVDSKGIDLISVEKTIKPEQDSAQYAYLISVTLKTPAIASCEYVISGTDGKILEKNDMVLDDIADLQGKGPFDDIRTLKGYQGQVPDPGFPQIYDYALADLSRQAPEGATARPFRILTYEFNDITEIASDVDGNFDSDRQSHVTDTHFYMGEIYEFYKEKFKRYSIDNAGKDLESYCHYSNPLSAHYVPGSNKFYIGDGDGKNFKTFATAEVMGHEFTHGVIMNECLMAPAGQPCSINEGLADLFAEVFSSYADGTPIDWLKLANTYTPSIDDDAYLDYKNPQTRPIYDPNIRKIVGYYPNHMENFYYGTLDSNGAHANAAILTKAFSLMCTGQSFHNINVTAIDPDKLAKIMYKVITEYLTPFTDFKQFAVMSLDAAAKLYYENSPEYNSLKEGFQAVGILNGVSEWSKINESQFKINNVSFATAQLNDKVYFIGGASDVMNENPSKEVWEYDISNNKWSQKRDISDFRVYGKAAAANNRIYMLLGQKDNLYATCNATVDEYNPSTDTWDSIARLPERVVQATEQFSPGTVITKTLGIRDCHFEIKTGEIGVNGLVTVKIQGSDDNINFRDLSARTVSTSNSTTEFTLYGKANYYRLQAEISGAPCTFGINSILGRYDAGIAAYNNKVYVIGGSTYSGHLISEVDIFDTINKQWSTSSNNLTYPSRYLTVIAATVNSIPYIYVFGGTNEYSNESHIEVYDINSDEWSAPASIPENINILCSEPGFHEGVFHFIGNNSNTDGSMKLYNPLNNTWTNTFSGIQTEYGTCAVANGKLYYLGSTNSDISPIVVYTHDPLRISAFANSGSILVNWSKLPESISTNLFIDGNNVYTGTDKTFSYSDYTNSSKKHVMKVSQTNPYYGTLSSKAVCSVYQKLGDIDGNNVINTTDLSYIKRFSLDIWEPTNLQKISSDLNNDNKVNSTDYVILYRYLYNQMPYNTIGTLRFIIYGDVNYDGHIDFTDCELIKNYMEGSSNLSFGQTVAADVDGNGTVDASDSDYIKSYILGDNVIFPAVN